MSAKSPGKKGTSAAVWWVAGAAVVIVGGLVALSTLGGKPAPAPQTGAQGTPTVGAQMGAVKSDQERGATRGVIGSKDAPFKLIEYSDFL
jgi:hypothetical protein